CDSQRGLARPEIGFQQRHRYGQGTKELAYGDQHSSGTNKWVHIEPITLHGHPANGQGGLFASRKIPPNTFMLFYIGEVHAETRETSDYDLSLLKTTTDDGSIVHVGIDAQSMGNEARFINDYRGIKERPNAVFKEVVLVRSR
ncbi:16739_t:CDS:2, partial [Acaulospora colombiana]